MARQRRIRLTPIWYLLTRRHLTTLIGLLAVATFLFGLTGFVWQHQAAEAPQDWSIPIFKTVQLFLLNSGADHDTSHPNNLLLLAARLCASVLFIVVSGAVIKRITDDVRKRLRIEALGDHVVICGLGEVGLQLLEDIHAKQRSNKVIVVEKNPESPYLDYARHLGAIVVQGDATKDDVLDDIRATSAKEIFLVTGDDRANMEIAALLSRCFVDNKIVRPEPLRIYAHILDIHFATSLRPYCEALQGSSYLSVQVFNVAQMATTQVVTEHLYPHAPKKPDEVAHYVIVGFGAMGQALAFQLAQLAQFPNRKRSRFTIADQQIAERALPFLERFSRFTSWIDDAGQRQLGVSDFHHEADAWEYNDLPLPADLRVASPHAIQYVCNAEFVELPAGRGNERFAKLLASRFQEAAIRPAIFICGENDRDNFEIAVQLRDQLICQNQGLVPIFVWLPHQPALSQTLSGKPQANFIPFGECHTTASYEAITQPVRETVGKKIQEDYELQATRRADREGDVYVPQDWSEISDAFRESSRVAADHMLIKLRSIGVRLVRKQADSKVRKFQREFPAETKRTLAQMEHYRWVSERLLAGWRYCPKGATKEEINEYKKRKWNHNITTFEGSESEKDFNQIEAIYQACQSLDDFVLEPSPDTPNPPT